MLRHGLIAVPDPKIIYFFFVVRVRRSVDVRITVFGSWNGNSSYGTTEHHGHFGVQ